MQNIALFIFAHQDDEFGVFHEIENSKKNGLTVKIFYLTNGCYANHRELDRNIESIKVLNKLGVSDDEIVFLGGQLKVNDAEVACRAHDLYVSLYNEFSKIKLEISRIYTLALEGGHQDHDATNYLVAKIASKLDLLDKVYQFPLYHGKCPWWQFYKVISPIDENGMIYCKRIPIFSRFKYLFLCLTYKTQKVTFVGLLPFVALSYLIKGRQELQKLELSRIDQRPHEGILLYERRGRAVFAKIQSQLAGINCEKNGIL